jgi:hypothetical protein
MTRVRLAVLAAIVSVAAVVVSLVAIEVALRLLVPAPKVYRMLLPGTRVFEPDARFVHGITGPARYIVNEHGIRGRDFGADGREFRVLMVGGSTTECGMLDETENWGSIAEGLLGKTADGRAVWFGNVGRSGMTSRDHTVTIKYLLPQHPKMDLLVVLLGVNDLTAALRQGASYRSPASLSDPDAERTQVRNAFALSPAGFRDMLTSQSGPQAVAWYKRTRLFELAKRARTGMQARQVARGIGGATLGQWRDNRRSASRIIDQLPDLTQPLADYRRSLDAIVAQARAHDVELMFLTQPALWRAGLTPAEEQKLWLGGTGNFQEEPGHEYYSPAALGDAMARYNAETMALCRERQLSCLDLGALVPKDTTMMYDDVHFTEAGAAMVGRLLATHLRVAKPALFPAVAAPATPGSRP